MKIQRNQLCPCGSKLKWKDCCGKRLAKKEQRTMENHKLKNDFKKEVEKDNVSSEELVQRDLYVMLLQLRCRIAMCAADTIHMGNSIKLMEQFKAAIEALPLSGGRTACSKEADQNIESLEKQKELCFPARQQVITLTLLEEKFGKKNAALGEVGQDIEGGGEGTADLETETEEIMGDVDDDLDDSQVSADAAALQD